MSSIKDERELLSKPGDTLLETLEALNMSQADLARRIGKTPSKINDIISGKEPITEKTALQLENVFGIDAKFWLNLEINYRIELERIEQDEALETCKDWLKRQPIKELRKNGYIKSDKVSSSMVSEFLQFYGVNTPAQWQSLYVENYAATAFRKSEAHAAALGSMAAWLRIGEIEMRNLDLQPYNNERFKEVLAQARQLVKDQPEDFPIQLQQFCAQAGVAIVYTPYLPKAPVSGATRWVGGHPLIQLSDRYKTNNEFWFTFFHEAAHVLLHGKKEVFIESFGAYQPDEKKEKEADDFSENYLLPDKFVEDVPEEITEKDIRRIARLYNTHPAIVLHRLYRMKRLPYSFGSEMKLKINLSPFINTRG